MKDHLLIEIVKNDTIIGNCLYEGEINTFDALLKVKNIIDNYNNRLSNFDYSFPRLAYAMLSLNNKELKNPLNNAKPTNESCMYISGLTGIPFTKAENSEEGIIAISTDIKSNEKTAPFIITINLDKKIIINGMLEIAFVDDFASTYYNIPPADLDIDIFPKTDIDIVEIGFLDLDDAITFIENNDTFMIEKDDAYIYMRID